MTTLVTLQAHVATDDPARIFAHAQLRVHAPGAPTRAATRDVSRAPKITVSLRSSRAALQIGGRLPCALASSA